jgi:hypothetical protein
MIATMRVRLPVMATFAALLVLVFSSLPAAARSPSAWVRDYWPTARAAGSSWEVYTPAKSA